MTKNELLEFYSDRTNELKEQGVKYPMCEGFYSNIDFVRCELVKDKLEVWAIASWQPTLESPSSILRILVLNDLLDETWSVDRVKMELSDSIIEIIDINI